MNDNNQQLEVFLVCVSVASFAAAFVHKNVLDENQDRSIHGSLSRLRKSLDEQFESFGSRGG